MLIDFKKYPFPANKIRHHLSTNMYLPLSELKITPFNYPPVYETINWAEHFDNGKAPDCLDIGSGRGLFLLNYALAHPAQNILGIEVRDVPVNWLEQIIEGEKISNCSILRYSIANLLPFIQSNSIELIFYFFPDPWPKRKHFRRRVFSSEFLNECHRVLKPDGKLLIATDCDYVNEYHLEVLKSSIIFEFRETSSFSEWDLPITNKEKFCIANNLDVYRLVAFKKQ